MKDSQNPNKVSLANIVSRLPRAKGIKVFHEHTGAEPAPYLIRGCKRVLSLSKGPLPYTYTLRV